MSPKLMTRRRVGLLGVLAITVAAFSVPASAANLHGQFYGEAWGNRANARAGDVSVRLGRAAYQACPCGGTGANVRSKSVHDVSAGNVYRAAELRSTAQAMKQSGMRAFGQTTSRVANVSVLDGFVQVDALLAVATVNATSGNINVSADGSSVVGLRIGGAAVAVRPGARINLAGFGYAVFFDVQQSGDGSTRRAISVEMMRIVITRNNALGLPIGALITVGHARVGYARQESRSAVGAAAWGSEATSGVFDIENRFGRSAPASLGCFATESSSGSNRLQSVTYPNVLHSATIVNRVQGQILSSTTSARASSRLQTVNLLNGMVTADVIQGVASATVNGSGGSASFAGSGFVDLKVLGVAIGDDVAPNTQIAMPGVGRLTLFATEGSSDADEAHASVYMVILQVDRANRFGLPVGTEIRLARARADANRP